MVDYSDDDALVTALTVGAVQRYWRTPSEFPRCPAEPGADPTVRYAAGLGIGEVFCRNRYGVSIVVDYALVGERPTLWVLTTEGEDAIKPWALAAVTYEDELYVHTSRGSFFSREGADKQFCLAQGLEWIGGDSIDDYS